MIGVVPPVDRVVEIERVADGVDEKRQNEENVARGGVRGTPTTSSPDRRNDERRDRVTNESPAKCFSGEPLKPGESPEGEQKHQSRLDSHVEPKGRSQRKGAS